MNQQLEITDVRVSIRRDKRLRGFASITFDNCFVVRGLKIIEGRNGLFVAMPNRKLKQRCPECGFSNSVGNRYCGGCGVSLSELNKESKSKDKRLTHKDIAHPIDSETRSMIEEAVLQEYELSLSNYDGYEEDYIENDYDN